MPAKNYKILLDPTIRGPSVPKSLKVSTIFFFNGYRAEFTEAFGNSTENELAVAPYTRDSGVISLGVAYAVLDPASTVISAKF